MTAKIVQYNIAIQLQPEAADYTSCVKKTKLEKKQDRISKKCDMPLTEVCIVVITVRSGPRRVTLPQRCCVATLHRVINASRMLLLRWQYGVLSYPLIYNADK